MSIYFTLNSPCKKILKKPKIKFKAIIDFVFLSKLSRIFKVIFLYLRTILKIKTIRFVYNAKGIL